MDKKSTTMDTKAIQQLAESHLTMMFMGEHETYIRKAVIAFGVEMFEAGAAAASPQLNSVESPCAKKHPELYTGSYCFKCGRDYLHCPEPDFTMQDFEKGLMLAGLVPPSNEQEKAEKEVLDGWEAPAPQAIQKAEPDQGAVFDGVHFKHYLAHIKTIYRIKHLRKDQYQVYFEEDGETRQTPYCEADMRRAFEDGTWIKVHYELIKCPECNTVQQAMVEHTAPFATFIHHCSKCNHIIMESEWDRASLRGKEEGERGASPNKEEGNDVASDNNSI
jgi:phage FluMu protein Com